MLSTVSMTVAMDPTASGMIGQIATAHAMVIDGQTMPHASVKLHLGKTMKLARSDGSGHFQFKLSEPSGTYLVKIKARNHAGQVSKTAMTVTKGDAVIAWIDTMIEVIKADIANVGMASRTLAMVSGAVYDAVNDIDRTGSVYKFDVHAPQWASPSAAASEAAYTILSRSTRACNRFSKRGCPNPLPPFLLRESARQA